MDDYQKALHAMSMFIDIFGLNRFELNSLIRFTLTVKKNYRRVPYHNWTHGFSVANTMYCIIKNSRNVFRPNEVMEMVFFHINVFFYFHTSDMDVRDWHISDHFILAYFPSIHYFIDSNIDLVVDML